MNAHSHRQRISFLALLNNLGTITPEQRAELDRLASIRVTQTTCGTLVVERQPMSLEDWKVRIVARNAQHREECSAELEAMKHKNT